MSTTWALVASSALLAANGFFVAAEFALVAAKRHRLEQAATTGSRAAAAALAGSRQLSLMLAGAQLGITVCSLGLGALAEPAVAHLLDPLFLTAGLPAGAAHAVAFLAALAVVVFLHMVVGEMAPKSWAISHPERSALLVALPFRAYTIMVRPVLHVLNVLANAAVRAVKVTPQDELAHAHGPQELQMLIESSREHGLLPADEHRMLTRMLALQQTTVAQVMLPIDQAVTVDTDASPAEVEQVSHAAGRSRLPVVGGGRIGGIMHVRDALRATTNGEPATAGQLMTTPLTLGEQTSVAAAVQAMRAHRAQLALTTDPDGTVVGLVAMEDLLEEVIGEFDDETDQTP
ncbi:MAG TPA: hemolysin family protein [Micromonosporaceae bacterium]